MPPALAPALKDVHLDAGLRIMLDLPGHIRRSCRGAARPRRRARLRPEEARHFHRPRSDRRRRRAGNAARLGRRKVRSWPNWPRFSSPRASTRASICADGRVVHAAGGSPGAGTGLRARQRRRGLARAGGGRLSLDDARKLIDFRLAADADEFLTLAKFRALRRLWASDRARLRP